MVLDLTICGFEYHWYAQSGGEYLWPDGLLHPSTRDNRLPLMVPGAWPGFWRSKTALEQFIEDLNTCSYGGGI